MQQPLVSVIIPAYNAARFILQAIDSALTQTLEDIEVLVVDDGSTDDTLALVEEVARLDGRIRIFSQANGGVGAARNRAIAEARGRYLAPLDADDFWYPEKLSRQVSLLEERGEDWGLAYCWSRSVDEEGHISYPLPHWPVEGDILCALIYRNIIGNASVPLMRTSAVRAVGGYLTRADQGGAQGCEDWDLALKVTAKYSAAAIPEYLVAYRQIQGTMSSDYSGMAGSYEFTMKQLRRRQPELPRNLFRWSAGHFYMYLLNTAHGTGNSRESFRLIGRLLQADAVMIFCPTIYRILVVSLLRLVFGRSFLRRDRSGSTSYAPLTGWNPRRVLWIPAHIVEARRWSAIKNKTSAS